MSTGHTDPTAPTSAPIVPIVPIVPQGGELGPSTGSSPVVVNPPVREAPDNRQEPDKKQSIPDSSATSIEKQSPHLRDTAVPMLKKEPLNVLPLHLVPIDSFFLADDNPRYPMTSIIRLEFSGRMDEAAFSAALDSATARHPLTRAVIRPAKQNKPCWVHDPQVSPRVDWGMIDDPIELAGEERIDLTRESGIRFWIRNGDDRCVMTLQVHHACTDGTGVYRFIGDLLAVYGQNTLQKGQRYPDLAELDQRLLRHRRTRFAKLAITLSTADFIRFGIKQTLDIFARRITPLAVPGGRKGGNEIKTAFPGVASYQFDKDEHKRLRAFASEHGAMLNDVLMAEMFRTIVRWNKKHSRRKSGTVRIMMPSDLREQQDYPMPATNMTAYTFLGRKASQCEDMGELIKGVREETARIKHEQLGRGFMDTVQFGSRGMPILKFLLRRNRCISSTILSNVGDPSKRFTAGLERKKGRIVAGNLCLEDVTGVPPMRIQSHATLAIFSYLRKLTVSVRCDPYEFDEQQTREFLEMYADGLRSHIA